MSTWKSILLAGTIAVTPLHPAFAQEAPAAEVVAPPISDSTEAQSADEGQGLSDEAMMAGAKAKMQKEMDAAIALVEKMFDTSDLPPIEPARLTLAERTTAALIPDGSLEKMMDNLYGKMLRTMLEETGGNSDLSLSIKTGVESDRIAALDADTKNAVADLFDPHRKEREDRVVKVIRPLISEALADLEPPMRAGLAKAYARKFSADQLTELNAFFATPTGQSYAGESLALQADPEVMLAVIKAVPPLVTKFIDRAPTIEGQLKDLPKEKGLADLSDAEMKKLAKLMKVDVQTLKDNRDMWSGDGEPADAMIGEPGDEATWDSADAAADGAEAAVAADAADAAAAAADAAIDDPAYDRDNWSEADRQRVEQLEEAASNASSAAFDAQEEAVANARKKTPSP
ncbi:DUF2059 domain-containing protein [Sphingopyxis sp. NJF-3]